MNNISDLSIINFCKLDAISQAHKTSASQYDTLQSSVEFLSLKNREFVQACHTLGMSDLRVMMKEILPNCLSPIIVIGSLMVATAILIESGLAFLGLGDPNIMSWGFQIGAGRTMLRSAWWVCTFPGVAILITVLAINLIGEGLNDALNPRLKERQ